MRLRQSENAKRRDAMATLGKDLIDGYARGTDRPPPIHQSAVKTTPSAFLAVHCRTRRNDVAYQREVEMEAWVDLIDTVIVVMMENRSFDHLLGFLSHESF